MCEGSHGLFGDDCINWILAAIIVLIVLCCCGNDRRISC